MTRAAASVGSMPLLVRVRVRVRVSFTLILTLTLTKCTDVTGFGLLGRVVHAEAVDACTAHTRRAHLSP